MSAYSPTPTPVAQPKIAQRLALRTLFLVLFLGAVYFGYQWWKDKSQDITALAPGHTAGWIAAVQYQTDGQQAVAISPEGKLKPSPNWKTGNSDRDLTWNPSGNRLFFVSDREENNFNVFRWNPTDGSDPVRRTVGSRSRSEPQFTREPAVDGDDTALITSGGFILEYTPKDMSTRQVLPPLGKEIVQSKDEEGGGQSDQFSGVYSKLGNSFKVARWCKGKNWIAAVMLRDTGEILVLQNMTPKSDGTLPIPMPVFAGDHVDFDVNPKDGTLVYCVQNFQWPDESMVPEEFRKGNKITRPFNHVVGQIDPDDLAKRMFIAISKSDVAAFTTPVISPDGASLALIAGVYENSSVTPKALASVPIQAGGFVAGATLARGEIYEPSWSPDGQTLAYAERQKSGKRSIVKINKDGSGRTDLTGDAGNFGFPSFSPQVKTP